MKTRFGPFVLDTDAHRLQRGNAAVHLTPKALELLALLIAERPRAVSKKELYDRLWPGTYVVDANLPVLIREIRKAVGTEWRSVIRTVHRFGYSFSDDTAPAPVHLLLHEKREFALWPGENVIGRDPQADVVIASSTISRRHAVITVRGIEATLDDLQSKNGTRLAGRLVEGPTPLLDGVVIRIGAVELIYRCPASQSETESLHDPET